MLVAQSALTINLDYVPGLGEEVFDTQTRKTYKGDGYTKVRNLIPLDGGTATVFPIAAEVDYNNSNSGLAATNVQAAIDETYQFVQSVDTELGAHLLDTTAHSADAIVYNPVIAGEVLATNVQGALDQHFLDTTAHTAGHIPFVPTPTIPANNVQLAIQAVDQEIQNILAGGIVEAVDISYVPTAPITATNVQAALDQAATLAASAKTAADTANTNINAHILDISEAHTASAIKYLNSGIIPGVFDVQAALDLLAGMVASSTARKYATSVGNGSAFSFLINHQFGTRDVIVQVYSTTAPFEQAECDVEATDINNVTIRFATPPTTNQFRAVVG
jgi:hypothetical protein